MAVKVHRKILLTGAAGGLGSVLRDRLKADCDVLRVSDRADLGATRTQEEVMTADLADADAVHAIVEGVDAVVHMGGISLDGPFRPIMQANILGAYHLYEAVRKHGVKRVVFASSSHVTGFYRQSETITPDQPSRPDGLYGVSKAFGEDLSRFYFDRYGIETVCLRIGSSFAEPRDRRMLSTWLSFDDLHRLVSASLSAPVVGHSILYGVSNNALVWWDNASARHIGYRPQDSAEPFREAIYASTAAPDLGDPAVQFQGGPFVKAGPFDN